jgi:hypothetical protein
MRRERQSVVTACRLGEPTLSVCLFLLIAMLVSLCACSRPPADDSAKSADSQKLPFDRQPRASGISPSQTLIPSNTRLPEGTPIPIRLKSVLSSTSSHAGDTFAAVVDEPVTIDGQVRVAADTPALGRVLEAKAGVAARENSRESVQEPGYLRIVLVSLTMGNRQIAIETSSIFAKGGSRDEHNQAGNRAASARAKERDHENNIVFGVDRHLNFRLAQTVDLQQ